jgi:hypothetical protein
MHHTETSGTESNRCDETISKVGLRASYEGPCRVQLYNEMDRFEARAVVKFYVLLHTSLALILCLFLLFGLLFLLSLVLFLFGFFLLLFFLSFSFLFLFLVDDSQIPPLRDIEFRQSGL